MKRILYFLTLCLVFASCEKKEEVTTSGSTTPQTQESTYRVAGTLTVQSGETPFVAEDTLTFFMLEDKTMVIGMPGVKFAERMPAMDIFTDTFAYQLLSAERIAFQQDTVQMMMGEGRILYPDCPIANLVGEMNLSDGQTQFSCTFAHKRMGDMPATFIGRILAE